MEEKAKNAVKTFEDLAQAVADSGRPYDAGRIEKAYEMAAAAHAGQTRLSGESYVSHPVAVACLVVDLGLDIRASAPVPRPLAASTRWACPALPCSAWAA